MCQPIVALLWCQVSRWLLVAEEALSLRLCEPWRQRDCVRATALEAERFNMVPRRTILVLLLPFLLQSADAVVGADVHGPAPMTASAFQSALHVPEARLTNISSNATHTLFVWRPKRETLRPAPILRSPSMDDLWAPLLHDVSAYGESKPGTCYQKSHSTSFADSIDLVLPILTFSGALLIMLILDLVLGN